MWVLRRIGDENKMRHPVAQLQCPVEVPVAPDVAINHEKRCVAEQRQGLGDAAGGFQRAGQFW